MKKSLYLKTAIKSAKAAGKLIRRGYGKHLNLHYKTGMEFVTDVDTNAEKKIIETIRKTFPGHSIYGEESGTDKKESEFTWILDPLDGTTNYTISNPFFNTSIALVRKDEIITAVVFNPLMDDLFYAEKGKGAYLNDERISVDSKEDMRKTVLAFCHGSKKEHIKRATENYSRIKLETKHVRQMGAAALELAYVASGRISGFFMNNMNSYDVAAGALLVEEAGGKVTDFNGERFNINSKDILATNGRLHQKLLKKLE
ncbi:MAG: inositol monophosphatase family protein [Nanobdellota archaeon]